MCRSISRRIISRFADDSVVEVVVEKKAELSKLIEDDFSKVTLVNTLKYFKQKSGKNECVDATIKIL